MMNNDNKNVKVAAQKAPKSISLKWHIPTFCALFDSDVKTDGLWGVWRFVYVSIFPFGHLPLMHFLHVVVFGAPDVLLLRVRTIISYMIFEGCQQL